MFKLTGQRFEVVLIPSKKGRHRILGGGKVIGEVTGSIIATNLMECAFLGSVPLLNPEKTRILKIIGTEMMMGGGAADHEMSFSYAPTLPHSRLEFPGDRPW